MYTDCAWNKLRIINLKNLEVIINHLPCSEVHPLILYEQKADPKEQEFLTDL